MIHPPNSSGLSVSRIARHALLLLLGTPLLAAAQDHPSASFDPARTEPVLDERGASMGSVALESSCEEEAAIELRRGLALLHNMTYGEAEAAFGRAIEDDPACGLAYWGRAMVYLHPLWPDVPSDEQLVRGMELLKEARDRGLGSPREEAWVEALEAYYRDGPARTEKERLADYADAWSAVRERFPGDPEAALFSALAMIATAAGDDPSYARQVEAATLAEQVLEAIPDHPGAHHYVIHALDVPALAERAVPVARSYGDVAPENSHALHMTSHIFTRRGLWDESIDYNRRAAEAALNAPVGGNVSFHHLHALDYLVYAHLQKGADAEAESLAEHLEGLDGPMMDHTATAYALAAIPARLALERRRWSDAVDLKLPRPDQISWDSYPHLVAINEFSRALGAIHTGDLDAARAAAERLSDLRGEAAELPGSYDWASQVEIQERAVRAWIAYGEGRTDAAVELMREAARLEASTNKNPVTPGEVLPASELLGDMLLELGRYGPALEAYEAALERSRNRFHSLAGAGLAAERLGDRAQAASYYRTLLEIAGASDSRASDLARIRRYIGGA